ncbi:MAG TPA: myo-inosose-2 dehydratase [Acetobacteraceae bacterium]|nr:myo-inosose-2 dehydratase [Acetobacteraceae bacterium]
MPVRLGTNPIAWSNDDLRELGGTTPLEICLHEARQAGFDGIEMGHKFPTKPDALRAALQPHGLALVSGWYSAQLLRRDATAERAAIRPHLDLLKALGCQVLIIAETSNATHGNRSVPLSRRPVLAEAGWREFASRLTDLGKAVADHGLELVYHHHMGTVVQTEAEIDRLMETAGPSLHLLLDTGHATFAGADPVALAHRWRERIRHVHCKDVRATEMRNAQQQDLSFLDAVVAGVFTVPGDGMIDFGAVLRELPGYDRWLVVEAEQDPDRANPLHYARLGHANLHRFAVEAGLS